MSEGATRRWYRVRSIRHDGSDVSPIVDGYACREAAGTTAVVVGGVLIRMRPGLARQLFELGSACEEGFEPQHWAHGGAVEEKKR